MNVSSRSCRRSWCSHEIHHWPRLPRISHMAGSSPLFPLGTRRGNANMDGARYIRRKDADMLTPQQWNARLAPGQPATAAVIEEVKAVLASPPKPEMSTVELVECLYPASSAREPPEIAARKRLFAILINQYALPALIGYWSRGAPVKSRWGGTSRPYRWHAFVEPQKPTVTCPHCGTVFTPQ